MLAINNGSPFDRDTQLNSRIMPGEGVLKPAQEIAPSKAASDKLAQEMADDLGEDFLASWSQPTWVPFTDNIYAFQLVIDQTPGLDSPRVYETRDEGRRFVASSLEALLTEMVDAVTHNTLCYGHIPVLAAGRLQWDLPSTSRVHVDPSPASAQAPVPERPPETHTFLWSDLPIWENSIESVARAARDAARRIDPRNRPTPPTDNG